MRIYLGYELDESYTPTKIKFYGGMSNLAAGKPLRLLTRK